MLDLSRRLPLEYLMNFRSPAVEWALEACAVSPITNTQFNFILVAKLRTAGQFKSWFQTLFASERLGTPVFTASVFSRGLGCLLNEYYLMHDRRSGSYNTCIKMLPLVSYKLFGTIICMSAWCSTCPAFHQFFFFFALHIVLTITPV